MVEDRDYMRYAGHEPRVSVTVSLLILNLVVFIAQLIGANTYHAGSIENTYFALSLAGLKSGYVWQLLTFQLMHASWPHLILNSIGLFFFGRAVEGALGGRKFLTLYLSSGVIGGLVQMLFTLILRQPPEEPVVGASAGICGLVGAFALMNWTETFTIFLYFFPVTMRGRTLFWVSLAMAAGGMILSPATSSADPNHLNVANAAHFGGILAGFFYIRQIVQGRWHLPQWKLPARRPPMPRELAVRRAGKKQFWTPGPIPPQEDLSPDEYLQKEVDPILDKISARGIQSLTQREREVLEKARSRMNKR